MRERREIMRKIVKRRSEINVYVQRESRIERDRDRDR